ncbi:hypothetical protein ACFODZ_11790, partial [Marinicella sediminis]
EFTSQISNSLMALERLRFFPQEKEVAPQQTALHVAGWRVYEPDKQLINGSGEVTVFSAGKRSGLVRNLINRIRA